MNKFIFGVIALVVILGGGVVYLARTTRPNVPVGDGTVPAISASDWWRGTTTPQAVLVEYGDFQCPACRSYQPVVNQLMNEFGDRIEKAYRHFPLPQHRNAKAAAAAAEAAGRQGKFWEMSDMLYEKQDEWSSEANPENRLRGYAAAMNLDLSQFQKDLNDPAIMQKIESDARSGTTAGVNSTPTFFLNGKALANPPGYPAFKQAIENALSQ